MGSVVEAELMEGPAENERETAFVASPWTAVLTLVFGAVGYLFTSLLQSEWSPLSELLATLALILGVVGLQRVLRRQTRGRLSSRLVGPAGLWGGLAVGWVWPL